MRQSRLMSLVEAVANVVVGYGVAVATQLLVFPLFGLQTTLGAEPRDRRDLHRASRWRGAICCAGCSKQGDADRDGACVRTYHADGMTLRARNRTSPGRHGIAVRHERRADIS